MCQSVVAGLGSANTGIEQPGEASHSANLHNRGAFAGVVLSGSQSAAGKATHSGKGQVGVIPTGMHEQNNHGRSRAHIDRTTLPAKGSTSQGASAGAGPEAKLSGVLVDISLQ